jgi:hypothetical protein
MYFYPPGRLTLTKHHGIQTLCDVITPKTKAHTALFIENVVKTRKLHLSIRASFLVELDWLQHLWPFNLKAGIHMTVAGTIAYKFLAYATYLDVYTLSATQVDNNNNV